jgi:hypothetical protein
MARDAKTAHAAAMTQDRSLVMDVNRIRRMSSDWFAGSCIVPAFNHNGGGSLPSINSVPIAMLTCFATRPSFLPANC